MPLTNEQINVLKKHGAELTQFIDIENGLLTKLYAANVITNAQQGDINSQVRSIDFYCHRLDNSLKDVYNGQNLIH